MARNPLHPPLWKDKRSVNITYKLLPADSAGLQKLDDLVQYQGTNSEKIKSVQGLHTATPVPTESVLGLGFGDER
ncbi:hypothetical protein N7445_010623 [Penicillium cf. griseofulvum]|nr:hypothetical protein N7445_010623 [Penicillium cf. griseofulvum]